jgi:hypothetical protein
MPTLCVVLACITNSIVANGQSYTYFGNEFKVITIVTNQFKIIGNKVKKLLNMMFIYLWVDLGVLQL